MFKAQYTRRRHTSHSFNSSCAFCTTSTTTTCKHARARRTSRARVHYLRALACKVFNDYYFDTFANKTCATRTSTAPAHQQSAATKNTVASLASSSSLSSQCVCVCVCQFHARSRGADVVETLPSSSSSSRTCTHFVCGRLSAQRNGDDGVGFGVVLLAVVWSTCHHYLLLV